MVSNKTHIQNIKNGNYGVEHDNMDDRQKLGMCSSINTIVQMTE
jgi:hypothetical protein